jgi:PiT family inorganic phosphate transporter
MIIGGLAGAIVWSTLCTYFGLPISNSHSLVGGIMGAGIMGLGFEKLIYGGLTKVFAGIVIAPIGGIIFGLLLTGLIITIFASRKPAIVNKTFGRLQIISSAWFALTHGANDGQKTMGIIALILFSAGIIPELEIPLWVILAAASAMGLGTFFGGYKVIKTLGVKITKLKPYQGFAAETSGGIMLAIFATLGIPASTTHAITGTIMGAGAARRKRAVRWNVSRHIVFSWIITIPGSAALGIGFTYLIHLFV